MRKALRARRKLLFGARLRFDDALRPRLVDSDDLHRAIAAASIPFVPLLSQKCPTVPNLSQASQCIFEARAWDGSMGTGGTANRAWCRTHGFDCPELSKGGQ
jgi:hypothetical protein